MAPLRFSPDLDPVSNLLTLQTELERFLRNPAIRLGVSGPGDYPPVNIFDDGEGIVVMAEIPGMDPASLNVSGQSHTLTIEPHLSPLLEFSIVSRRKASVEYCWECAKGRPR